MGRPKRRAADGPSQSVHVRLHPQERAGLQALGQALQLPPSRIHRRLLREAINGGPDFFENGIRELRTMRQHLAAIGRNLNQLTRAVNRGDVIDGADLRRVINAGRVQVAAVEALHLRTVAAAAQRAWQPLYREAGLPSPFDTAPATPATQSRPARPPGREPAPAERGDHAARGGRFSPTQPGD